MRTTINLPDGLAEEAKRRAQVMGTAFTSLIVDGLRRVLAEADRIEQPSPGRDS